MKVKDYMCNNNDLCCAKPENSVYDIAKIMQNYQIGCVPICDNNNCIVGLVTDRDIVLRAITSGKDIKTTPISDIMTTSVCCCTADEDIVQAENKMAENQIRRLPVIDKSNKVVGILTMGDLAHYDKEIGREEVCSTIESICSCEGQVKNNK